MKYFLKVMTALVLAVAVVFGVYYYTDKKPNDEKAQNVSLTTVSKAPATEKNSNLKLIASLEKEGFYLYKGNKSVILKHKDKEFEFDNWNSNIDLETPKMYYANFDDDKEKELIIRAVGAVNQETKEYIYDLYILNPKQNTKEEEYDVILATHNTWSKILNSNIREEVTQLKRCKKILQIAMDVVAAPISYDKKTGVAKTGYRGYARALQDSNGNYLTIDKWEKGRGVYSISEDNKICVDVPVNVRYKESKAVQKIGFIHFEFNFDKSNKLAVTRRSMVFTAAKEYQVSSQINETKEKWTYTENNSDKSTPSSDTIIDWIKYKTAYSPSLITQTTSFAGKGTDINGISKIVITQEYIELTAKKGMEFAKSSAEKGEFSVIMNEGYKSECDIAYKAAIGEKDGVQTLKISFDKKYSKKELGSITVNYATK